jgi:hypothetical protein
MGITAASGPVMDTDLQDSHASFIGENGGESSAREVEGVGDVNGDGYDDFIISAPFYSKGILKRGSTYLIFGKPSGWSKDIDLSKANASFLGERGNCLSGTSVSGAGDVNGDGYDDILIGAWRDGEGAELAGQTYLILGKKSGWSMNTSLGNSDASFWGEVRRDEAGNDVAGVGDVNGDGYDDFLIGASLNDEGSYDGGQTFLIFGRKTGWSMDQSLANANASFWGEALNDYSGGMLAGAGDINGDGYDDILIGVPNNDEGSNDAGQAYLIFGKPSGWSMDINLSNVNASFLGEGKNNYFGESLAGAGDVNGDGIDDFIIGAHGNSEAAHYAGQSYLFFGKKSGWSMDAPCTQANASFWGENPDDYSGRAVSGAGDFNNDGYNDLLIGAYYNDDGGSAAGQTYLIYGKKSGWSIDTNLSNADASFWGEDADDRSGETLGCAGDVNGDGYDDILIGAPEDEEGGGGMRGQTYLFFYSDGAPPKIERDSTPGNATTGDLFTFNITVSDNYGVHNVTIEYWYGEDQSHINETSNRSSGDKKNGTWLLNITIPQNSTATLHYIVHAFDTVFTPTSPTRRDVKVWDNDRPELVDSTQGLPTTGDRFTVTVNVTDNIGISGVNLVYWFGGDPPTNTTMDEVNITYSGNGTYRYNITVSENSIARLRYYFAVNDTYGNWNSTSEVGVAVTDNDAPIIVQDLSDTVPTTGDPFRFKVEVVDNIEVGRVYVSYRLHINDDPTHLNMTADVVTAGGNGTYVASIYIPLSNRFPLEFNIQVLDTSLNLAFTKWQRINITDNDSVTLGVDYSDSLATTGDPFHFGIHVHDWVGISDVEVVYWFDDLGSAENVTMVVGPGMTRIHDGLTIPVNSTAPLHYYFQAWDTSNNWNRTIEKVVTVIDNDAPTFGTDDTNAVCIKGTTFEFSIEAIDNIGIEEIKLVYWWLPSGMRTNLSMAGDSPYTIAVLVPRNPVANLYYNFYAVDTAGNWNETEEATILPVNRPPFITFDEVWTVTEGNVSYLNLTTFIGDDNDDIANLTLEYNARYIYWGGTHVMGALYHEWMPDHQVEVSLTDGEDTVYHNITVRVINVNDDPEITSKPSRQATVWRIYTYTVEYTDEDVLDTITILLTKKPDGMTISEEGVVTWTPTRSQHDWHWVHLSLSDGNVTLQQWWPILVRVETPEPDNRPPVPSGTPPKGATWHEPISWTWAVTDPDGDTLHFHLVDGPYGATMDNQTGLLEWVAYWPPDNYTFVLDVTDGINTVPLEFIMRVRPFKNQAPAIQGTIEDIDTHKKVTTDLSEFMFDPDDLDINLTWSIEGGDTSLFGARIEDGDLVIEPVKGAKGTATITLKLEDPSGAFDAQEVDVTVEPEPSDSIADGFPWWILLVVIVAILGMAVFVLVRRPKETEVPEPGRIPEPLEEENKGRGA